MTRLALLLLLVLLPACGAGERINDNASATQRDARTTDARLAELEQAMTAMQVREARRDEALAQMEKLNAERARQTKIIAAAMNEIEETLTILARALARTTGGSQ